MTSKLSWRIGGIASALSVAAAALILLPTAPALAADTTTVAGLIEKVDPARSVFKLKDNLGHSMDTLKVVKHPTATGYIGVYHYLENGVFQSAAATSTDLKTWTFKRVVAAGSSQPYLAFTPGKNGAVLAVETATDNHLKFIYWTSATGMLGTAAPYIQFDAPRTLSTCAEGTPAIESVIYDSSTSSINTGTTIKVSHHYFENCTTDREAFGTLRNFGQWTTAKETAIDTALTGAGATDKHGDRDAFAIDNTHYRVYEGSVNATPAEFDMGDWRNFLWDGTSARQLAIKTPAGTTAFANPSVTVGPDPAGVQSVIVSQFIPGTGAGTGEAGQLLYWNPLPTAAPPPTSTTTTPPPPTTSDVVVAAIGDIACTPGGTVRSTTCQHPAVANTIKGMNAQALLPLGDIQYETGLLTAFQQSYDPAFGSLKAITYPAPGNHEWDDPGGNANGYKDYFRTGAAPGVSVDPTWYSYNLGGWHLISLDSDCTHIGGCGSTAPQTTWLKNDLAANDGKPTLVYWHHPVYTSARARDGSMQSTWNLLNPDKDVQLVLSGHDHNYERFAPLGTGTTAVPNPQANGVREFVVGTGGKSHYGGACDGADNIAGNADDLVTGRQPGSEAVNCTTFGALKLTLKGDGSYAWDFVNTDTGTGVFTDSGTQARRT